MNVKMFLKAVAIVCSVAYSGTIIAASNHKTIPPIFQGKWVEDVDFCNDDSHVPTLKISKRYLSFWESGGEAVSIVTQDKYELALIMTMSGEGEEWVKLYHFKLSDDKLTLTDITNPYSENPSVRHRCP